jgi:hypothetical protein
MSDLVVELPQHQLLEVLLPQVERLLPMRRNQNQKRVWIPCHSGVLGALILTIFTAKEESDEDMGFGLFD